MTIFHRITFCYHPNKREYTMVRRLPALLAVSLAISCLMVIDTAEAQTSRSDKARSLRAHESAYVRARVGLSTYGGDRDADAPESFLSLKVGDKFENASYSLSPAIGYAFSPYVSLEFNWQIGDYTMINNNCGSGPGVGCTQISVNDGSAPDLDSDSKTIRHSPSLMLRWLPFAHWQVTPYLQAGAHYSFGSVTKQGGGDETVSAFGPLAGFGVDIATGSRVSLFLEANGWYNFDDEGIDLADPISEENETSFDLLGFYGGGLAISFKSPCTPVEVLSVEGPDRIAIGEQATFTATVNADASVSGLTYRWDMDDGTTASGLTVTHTYSRPGNYNVRFTATNCGGSDSGDTAVEAFDPCPVPAQIVSIATDPADPIINENIRFSANVRADPPASYRWSFGDGGSSNSASPTHSYDDPGEYTVTLEVANCEDQRDSRTMQLPVREFRCSEITELNSVFFDRNSSELDDEAKALLDENIAILKECPEINVRLDGFASRGERRPQQLSEARASAVEQYYIENGISPNRLTARGLGIDPMGGKGKAGADRRNRRVDSIIVR
jgi:PKD repeat protein